MATKVQDWRAEAGNLDFEALEERLEHYQHLRDTKAEERRQAALSRIKEEMAQHGLSPEDLVEQQPVRKAPSAGRKMNPKYRDPSDSSNVWTGQGKAPKWMPENKEHWPDFLIK